MTDQQRQQKNTERLRLVDASIRQQVANVIATLEVYGHRPLIAADVWRSPDKQRELHRKGVSKLDWGFHCATLNEDKQTPASLAADIVCAQNGWNAGAAFWICLGYAARAQGLSWGGYWGLSRDQIARLQYEFEKIPTREPIAKGDRIAFGWDVAHVETSRVTVQEAKRGKR